MEPTKRTLMSWRDNFTEKGKEINIPHAMSSLLVNNIMVTIFGEDFSDRTLRYIDNGVEKTVNIAFALR